MMMNHWYNSLYIVCSYVCTAEEMYNSLTSDIKFPSIHILMSNILNKM